MRLLAYALRFSLPALGGLAAFATPAVNSLLAPPMAEAGPLRRPRIHTLLVDLTHIEANNGERDDRRTAQAIACINRFSLHTRQGFAEFRFRDTIFNQ